MKKLLLVLSLCGVMSPLVAMQDTEKKLYRPKNAEIYNDLNSPVEVTFFHRYKYNNLGGFHEHLKEFFPETISMPANSKAFLMDGHDKRPAYVKVSVVGEKTLLQKVRSIVDDSHTIPDDCFYRIIIKPNNSSTSIRGFDVEIIRCDDPRLRSGLPVGEIIMG